MGGYAIGSYTTGVRGEVRVLDYEQVSMPVSSAVHVMLGRAAAAVGGRVLHRVVVTNFEAALRVVRANLAISVVPREVEEAYLAVYGLRWHPARRAVGAATVCDLFSR